MVVACKTNLMTICSYDTILGSPCFKIVDWLSSEAERMQLSQPKCDRGFSWLLIWQDSSAHRVELMKPLDREDNFDFSGFGLMESDAAANFSSVYLSLP